MNEDAQISAVSETLFLPLYSLALESQRPNPIMVDEGAVELTRKLNAYFEHSDKRLFRRLAKGKLPSALLTSMSLRIRHYDRDVVEFLSRDPDGIVVNLGCGLNDRRRRCDNGRARFSTSTCPRSSICAAGSSRRPTACTSSRRRCSTSHGSTSCPMCRGARSSSWPRGCSCTCRRRAFAPSSPRLRERFPGAELFAEVASTQAVRMLNSPFGRGKYKRQFGLSENVVYSFGVDTPRDFERWAPGIELLGEWTYFDEDEPKLGWYRWFAKSRMLRSIQYTVRYRLGSADSADALP